MPFSSVASILEISNDLSWQRSSNAKRGNTYDTRLKMAIGLPNGCSGLALDIHLPFPGSGWHFTNTPQLRQHRSRISLNRTLRADGVSHGAVGVF